MVDLGRVRRRSFGQHVGRGASCKPLCNNRVHVVFVSRAVCTELPEKSNLAGGTVAVDAPRKTRCSDASCCLWAHVTSRHSSLFEDVEPSAQACISQLYSYGKTRLFLKWVGAWTGAPSAAWHRRCASRALGGSQL